jgi:hypothetical protein
MWALGMPLGTVILTLHEIYVRTRKYLVWLLGRLGTYIDCFTCADLRVEIHYVTDLETFENNIVTDLKDTPFSKSKSIVKAVGKRNGNRESPDGARWHRTH